jgi:hypothetical protein
VVWRRARERVSKRFRLFRSGEDDKQVQSRCLRYALTRIPRAEYRSYWLEYCRFMYFFDGI